MTAIIKQHEADIVADEVRRIEWIQRSVCLSFLMETVESEVSKTQYIRHIERFRAFTGIDEVDELMQMDPLELTKRIQMYIIELKKSLSPNSLKTYIAPIRSLCEVNEMMLNWKKINRFIPRKVKLAGQSAWQTSDIQKMLAATNKNYNRALIHVLASTGARIGGVTGLKVRDLTEVEQGCTMVKVYSDDLNGFDYTTFLTPEATDAVNIMLEERKNNGEVVDGESYLFRNRSRGQGYHGYHSHRLKPGAPGRALLGRTKAETEEVTACKLNTMKLTRIAESANIRGEMKGRRYQTQICHGFRKRFHTILKSNLKVNDSAVEKMMGHTTFKTKDGNQEKQNLDGTYLQMEDTALLGWFLNGVNDLTVSDSFRLKTKSEGLQDQLTKIREEIGDSITAEVQQQISDIKYRQSKRTK